MCQAGLEDQLHTTAPRVHQSGRAHYGSASLASLLEKRHRVEAMYCRHSCETRPCFPGGKRTVASVKAGGDWSNCVRMCSTKGRWVVAPCEMSVLKADLRRAGGTGHSGMR